MAKLPIEPTRLAQEIQDMEERLADLKGSRDYEIVLRHGRYTTAELAVMYGVTRRRVNQLLVRAKARAAARYVYANQEA